jgi:GH15 family glucan-1,4-alpha-glucosidase
LYHTNIYSTENNIELEFNELFNSLIEKNLFTNKQISIIYNKFNTPVSNISKNGLSAGAYYRQIKQCRKKYDQLIYTLVLFRLLNFIDNNTIETIESIIKQLEKISQRDIHHNSRVIVPNDIIIVIEKIISKINKI